MSLLSNFSLLTILLSTVYANLKPASTKDWLIEFHNHVEPDLAKRIAKRYAMVSRGPVGKLFSPSMGVSFCGSETNTPFDTEKTRCGARGIHSTPWTGEWFKSEENEEKDSIGRSNELCIKFLIFVPNVVIVHRMNINHRMIHIFSINGI